MDTSLTRLVFGGQSILLHLYWRHNLSMAVWQVTLGFPPTVVFNHHSSRTLETHSFSSQSQSKPLAPLHIFTRCPDNFASFREFIADTIVAGARGLTFVGTLHHLTKIAFEIFVIGSNYSSHGGSYIVRNGHLHHSKILTGPFHSSALLQGHQES